MRFIVLIMILSPFLWGGMAVNKMQQLPKTYITLNAQQGCSVHVAAWISPSCTHCAEYFAHDIPKIIAMPGFCLDLHFFPHLYLLDKPVSILILSQGPDNVLRNADFFFKNQNKWLEISASREKIKDREEDLEKFLKDIEADSSKNVQKIKNYLVANDPFLYVKMFALNIFSVEHLEHYLPKGDVDLISELSMALVKDLPRKDGAAVNFSPAFTNISGQLIPDDKLNNGILTPSVAEDMLKTAGPFVPRQIARVIRQKKVATKAQHIDIDDDIQDADEDESIVENPKKRKHNKVDARQSKKQKTSPYDNEEIEEDTDDLLDKTNPDEDANETTIISKKLQKIINEQLDGLDDEYDHHDLLN